MANITSSQHARRRHGDGSPPPPERIRPLRYKTALRLAFEAALRKAGFDVPENVSGPEIVTFTWRGTKAA